MSDRFKAPSAEELTRRGLDAAGKPVQKAAPKAVPKAAGKTATKKEG
jgi:hypothetical protein